MKKHNLTAVALTACTTLAAAMGTAHAGDFNQSPFAMQSLSSGYMVAENHEGKCGEGKCGADKKASTEGKCGEGKCGGDKKASTEGKCGEGKCGGDKKASTEGKCGEGKCGAVK